MGIKVSKSTPIFVHIISVVPNATNTSSTMNKKNVALSYHFVGGYVAKKFVEVGNIHTIKLFLPIHQTPGEKLFPWVLP